MVSLFCCNVVYLCCIFILSLCILFSCCFFFQAEDGIRVAHYLLEFRRVLFRSPPKPARKAMSVAQLVDEVTSATEDELGDGARLTDGVVTVDPCAGFFHREFDVELSDRYGIATTNETWECRASQLDGMDLSGGYSPLRLTFGGITYRVQDVRRAPNVNALLVLSTCTSPASAISCGRPALRTASRAVTSKGPPPP